MEFYLITSQPKKQKFLSSTIITRAREIKKGLKNKLILQTPYPVRDLRMLRIQ